MFGIKKLFDDNTLSDEYSKLYDYQKNSVKKVRELFDNSEKSLHGQIILPTGAGKTKIAEYLTADFMNQISIGENRCSLFNVSCHRLSLANNLAERILNTLRNTFKITNIKVFVCNSGNYKGLQEKLQKFPKDINVFYCKDETKGLEQHVKDELANGNHVMFISLYQSLNKLTNRDIQFDFSFYDEAHTSIQEQVYTEMEKFVKKSYINLFFTATPTERDNGRDMTNTDIYGEQLINVLPKEITLTKHVCPIEMVILDMKNKANEIVEKERLFANTENVIYSVKESANSLFKKVEEDSKGTKNGVLFVSVTGNQHLKPFLNILDTDNIQIKKAAMDFYNWRMENKVDIYITSSELQGNVDYWETDEFDHRSMDKEEFIEAMNKIGKERNNKAIIINIDQLSEGIDLPQINGVLIFRKLEDNVAKILQIIGRSVRRADEDRKLINDQTVKYNDYDKFIKPKAYVFIPTCGYTKNEFSDIVNVLLSFYPQYGSLIFKLATVELGNGTKKPLIENKNALNAIEEEMNNTHPKQIKWEEHLLPLLIEKTLTEEEKNSFCRSKYNYYEDNDEENYNKICDFIKNRINTNNFINDCYNFITTIDL